MEIHEAELFSKMLDALLKIVDKHVSPEDEAMKRVEMYEKLRQKTIPEQQTDDPTRAHFQPNNPPISIESEEPYLETE